jgi:hypothetical protein
MDKFGFANAIKLADFRVSKDGSHSYTLRKNWDSDEEVCNELGLEAEELIKLKHVTGFSKLFDDIEYRKAWKTRKQLRAEKKAKEKSN